jgi:Gas vesicle synthesis protein GvpL/GvpF
MATADRLGAVDLPGRGAPDEVAPNGQAIYLFALVDGAATFPAAGDASDRFPQPILHRAGPIAALIGIVPSADYCGADAAHQLNDLAWLAPRTIHHAAVLRRAMEFSPVYPAPFATLFASRDTLSAFMLAHAPTLGAFFRAVDGMAEWELKASACLDSRRALEALARDVWPDWAQLTPGTRYLRLCRDRPGLVAARRAVMREIAAGLAERLQPPAAALRHLVLQPVPDSGNGELIGRFALLVPLNGEKALAQRVEARADEAAADGIKLALSGPWPPFSFRPDLPRPPLSAKG